MTTFLFTSGEYQQLELDVLANLDKHGNDIEAAAQEWFESVKSRIAAGIDVDEDDEDWDERLGREVIRALHNVIANHHGRGKQ